MCKERLEKTCGQDNLGEKKNITSDILILHMTIHKRITLEWI